MIKNHENVQQLSELKISTLVLLKVFKKLKVLERSDFRQVNASKLVVGIDSFF